MPKSTSLSKITRQQKTVHPLDVSVIEKAQKRVFRLYRRIGKSGTPDPQSGKIVHGWRAVQHYLKLSNVNIAWKFVVDNEVPPDHATRIILTIPYKGVLPSERQPRKPKRIIPKIGFDGWEPFYFKTPKVRWKRGR